MNIKDLLEGYYAGTLTDSEEEQLEMLMVSGHPQIPEKDRKLYLGLTAMPETEKPAKKNWSPFIKLSSVAASLALILGLGYYAYTERQRQIITEEEILELAMGNVSTALHKSDTTRQQIAAIMNIINSDTTKTTEHNPKEI